MVITKNEKIDNQATEAGNTQFITVDGMKLCKGLQTAFWGVALVFASLHLEIPAETMATAARNAGESVNAGADGAAACTAAVGAATGAGGNVAGTTVAEEDDVTEATSADAKTEKPAKAAKKAKSEPVAKAEPAPVDDSKAPEPQEIAASAPASGLSIDDITKVIVQKIKKDRKNNEKIGAILKTYGIAKVSDLPADKYEAFLTDLAAI